MSVSERRGPGRKVLSRDTFSFVAGWFLIIYQGTIAEPFNPTVFVGGITIALVPGTLAAWAMRMGGAAPIEPPSSGSQQPAPSEP